MVQITSVKVHGLKELGKRLDKLDKVAAKELLEPALMKAAPEMAKAMENKAPDDPATDPPWDLGDSIEIGTRQRSGRAKNDRPLGRFEARIFIGPTGKGYPQAVMQEFGTSRHPAQPYMRPAWEAHKQGAMQTITVTYKNELSAALSKRGV